MVHCCLISWSLTEKSLHANRTDWSGWSECQSNENERVTWHYGGTGLVTSVVGWYFPYFMKNILLVANPVEKVKDFDLWNRHQQGNSSTLGFEMSSNRWHRLIRQSNQCKIRCALGQGPRDFILVVIENGHKPHLTANWRLWNRGLAQFVFDVVLCLNWSMIERYWRNGPRTVLFPMRSR